MLVDTIAWCLLFVMLRCSLVNLPFLVPNEGMLERVFVLLSVASASLVHSNCTGCQSCIDRHTGGPPDCEPCPDSPMSIDFDGAESTHIKVLGGLWDSSVVFEGSWSDHHFSGAALIPVSCGLLLKYRMISICLQARQSRPGHGLRGCKRHSVWDDDTICD